MTLDELLVLPWQEWAVHINRMDFNETVKIVFEIRERDLHKPFTDSSQSFTDIPEEMSVNVREMSRNVPKDIRDALKYHLADYVWNCGGLMDICDGIDPRKGDAMYGTPNHRSWTYKLRKAAGFSYP